MVPAGEGIVCYGCDLFETEPTVFTTIDGAVEHLLKHCIAGHKAPYARTIDMLRNTTIEMVDGKAVYGWGD
jgi:nitrate reductase assembly molybdenum cofactor insertion protein NarJ